MRRVIVLAALVAQGAAGCGDGNGVADGGADAARRDASVRDAAPDGSGDAGRDLLRLDQAPVDQAPGDLAPAIDHGADVGACTLTTGAIEVELAAGGQVTCGSAAASDCKGTLLIEAQFEQAPGLVKVFPQYLVADLSGGKTVTCKLTHKLPAGPLYYVGAHLYEAGSGTGAPGQGDLTTSSGTWPQVSFQPCQTAKAKVILDTRL